MTRPETLPEIVERVETPRGELVLRRAGEHLEIIANGVFLMDTRDGTSETLLVTAALTAAGFAPGVPSGASATVLLGGLGVGFSLVEALRHPRVREVTVVEVEPAVIDWHRPRHAARLGGSRGAGHLAGWSRGALSDPRTRVVCADVAAWLAAGEGAYDAVCLDVDNGPEWTVTPANAGLYGDAGLALLARHLNPGGALTVWSAMRSAAFERRLRARFAHVGVHPVPVARGEPDVIYAAAKPLHPRA
jgi:spermidine synthase